MSTKKKALIIGGSMLAAVLVLLLWFLRPRYWDSLVGKHATTKLTASLNAASTENGTAKSELWTLDAKQSAGECTLALLQTLREHSYHSDMKNLTGGVDGSFSADGAASIRLSFVWGETQTADVGIYQDGNKTVVICSMDGQNMRYTSDGELSDAIAGLIRQYGTQEKD